LTVEVFPQLPFVRDAATFDFEVATASEACDTSLELTVVDGDEQPVPGATVDVDAGTITFGPAVPGGEYTVVATCTDGQQPLEDEESMLFARGIVDKVVVGTAPEGATFTVAADCEGEGDEEGAPFTAELTFGPTGGSDFFVVYDGQTCEVA